ncbi:MAG: LysM peptidoglycan-binding domain-containing protein [Planctomycetota bacterium]
MKTGLVLGLALVTAAVLWLATRPSLSPKAEIPDLPEIAPQQENIAPPVPVATNEPIAEDNQLPAVTQPMELPDLTQYEQAEKIKTQKFHIVRKGETLSKISFQYYGSAGKWQKILEANRQTIKDANKLIPGTKLIIPD